MNGCAMNSWTCCGLVGAFLDLALAYLLLCGSTLVFFASRFLGFFGLCLPCPCNVLSGDPGCGMCLKRLFVDYPRGKISSVQMSVKSKFPFDSIRIKDQGCQLAVKFVRDRDRVNGAVEEASCSLFSDARGSQNLVAVEAEPGTEVNGFGFSSSFTDARLSQNLVAGEAEPRSEVNGSVSNNSSSVCEVWSDVYGKRNLNRKPRSGLRRQHRTAGDHEKFSSVSSSDTSRLNVRDAFQSFYKASEMMNGITEEISVPANSGGNYLRNDGVDSPGRVSGKRSLDGFEVDSGRSNLLCCQYEEDEIRALKQALEEEHAVRAALNLELEKERSAAATAAEEAMAVMLRLQKEKASIEMGARQYQRITEEKSAYDAEEMEILEKILLRRESEKHLLEKEVEAYRQTLLSRNEHLEEEVDDKVATCGQRPISFD